MIIQGGTGNGYSVKVDNENRLHTFTTMQELPAHASEEEGNCYMWTATADLAADKCLLYLKNTNTDMNLVIQKIIISPAAACQFEIWVGSNSVTVAGTSVTGVNMNLGSGNVALATATHTETGADLGGGVMTLLGTAWAGAGVNAVPLDGTLILGYLDEMAINLITDVGSSSANIMGFYHD
jgi:hypothetical protein